MINHSNIRIGRRKELTFHDLSLIWNKSIHVRRDLLLLLSLSLSCHSTFESVESTDGILYRVFYWQRSSNTKTCMSLVHYLHFSSISLFIGTWINRLYHSWCLASQCSTITKSSKLFWCNLSTWIRFWNSSCCFGLLRSFHLYYRSCYHHSSTIDSTTNRKYCQYWTTTNRFLDISFNFSLHYVFG